MSCLMTVCTRDMTHTQFIAYIVGVCVCELALAMTAMLCVMLYIKAMLCVNVVRLSVICMFMLLSDLYVSLSLSLSINVIGLSVL